MLEEFREKRLAADFLSDMLCCATERAYDILSGKSALSLSEAATVAGFCEEGVYSVKGLSASDLLQVITALRRERAFTAGSRQVLGFVFDSACRFWLVRKRDPEWQKGRLNGIGGKVSEGETSLEAMKNSGLRDLGIDAPWEEYACLVRPKWNCKVYCTVLHSGKPASINEELAGVFEFADLDYLPSSLQTVEGVRLLVIAAISRLKNYDAPYLTLSMVEDSVEKSSLFSESGKKKN